MNSELNMGPPIAPNGPHLEAILVYMLYLGCERPCMLEASAGAGGTLGW